MNKNSKMVYIALLVAQGVVLGLLERMIPFPFAIAPGAKLGLANLITVISLFTLSKRDSFLLVWLRLLLTTFLGGTASTLIFSAAGAMCSYFGMLLVKQLGPKRVSVIGISATGGFLHNVGQLVMQSLLYGSWGIMLYLPILSIVGILAGIALGIAANYLLLHVRTLAKFKLERDAVSQK